jgi:hypothetical protein
MNIWEKLFYCPFGNKIPVAGRNGETNKCGVKRIRLMFQGLNAKSEQKRKMATDLIINNLFMRDGNYTG